MELWEEGEPSKEPGPRAERPNVAAKIAKVSQELKQDVRPPPPPAVIAVGGVNEAKAYVPAIVPSEQASPEEDSQRVRVVDPREVRTEQLDRRALLEASRRADAAEKALVADSGEGVESPLAPVRMYWIAMGVAIGLGVVVVPLLWMLWRAPEPPRLGVPIPRGTAEVLSTGAAPLVTSVPGLASAEAVPVVVDTASASPAPSAAPESTAIPEASAAPSVKPAAMPSMTPAVKPVVKPAVKPSASPTTSPSSAPTGIPTEMVN